MKKNKLVDWLIKPFLTEDINIPVNVGDTILTGRFKNKKTVVKSIGKDEHGMPTINGKKVTTFRMIKKQEENINEGVNDPGILKAVFLAGGPGSGKTYVTQGLFGIPEKITLSAHGLKVVNSDTELERMLDKYGFGTDLDNMPDELFKQLTDPDYEDYSGLRTRAKELTAARKKLYKNGRLGMIIDGTGDNFKKIKKQKKELEKIGYDCYMVFVHTKLEIAQKRNMERPRKLSPKIVEDSWNEVQANKAAYQGLFGASNFLLVDNSKTLGEKEAKNKFKMLIKKGVGNFIRKPVKNFRGKQWIKKQKIMDEAARVPRKKGQHRNSPNHSDLYTDENPKGTIKGLKFATVKDAKASVSKIKSSGRSHAHKIQAAVAMEQRAKEMGKAAQAAVYRKYINQMKKKTKQKNESLKETGIIDFKSLFKKMPSDLQKRVYNLKNFGQRVDKHPEGNVLKHTITVVNRSIKEDDIDIAIAAMFHDIGKDETAGIHPKKGHITHFGHEKVSASLVKKYRNWIKSVGGNAANIFYIVKNHTKFKQLDNMRIKKVMKLKAFRAFDKLSKFSKHDRGGLGEGWSDKYKKSIDCSNPKGFSQKAHCAGKKKKESVIPSPSRKGVEKMKRKGNTSVPYGSGYKRFKEDRTKIKKVVGIYGGRFQPFGPHHKKTYEWLKSRVDDAYITTSNIKQPPRHPMNFREKVRHMVKMGIPKNRIVQEKSPYVATNVLKKYDEKTTAVIYIFGAKDAGRLTGGKYFKDYDKNMGNILGYKEHGYILTAPHVSVRVGGKEVSGTVMRQLLGSPDYEKDREKLFKKAFGYFDKGVYNMMTNKFKKLFESIDEFIIKNNISNIIKESSSTVLSPTDDGPPTFHRGFGDYRKYSKKWIDDMYAGQGWEVVNYILGKHAINPDYDYTLSYSTVPAVAYGHKQSGDYGSRFGVNNPIDSYKAYINDVVLRNLGYELVKWMGITPDGKSYTGVEVETPVVGGVGSDNVANTETDKLDLKEKINLNDYVKIILEVQYKKPNFEFEWEEAVRYPEFKKMGKEGWLKIAEKGSTIKYSEIKDVLGNVDLKFDDLEKEKKKRFKSSYESGTVESPIAVKFSDKDYDLIGGNTRLSGLVNNGEDPTIWIVDISNLKELKESLLLEGGAYGHMNHPFDDRNITFSDLKQIIINGLGGKLNREDNVTEKLDGQNLMVSWVNNKLVTARNKGQLKNFGATAMDTAGVASKFAGRGDIKDAFVFAMEDLSKSIGSLSDAQKEKVFGNGKRWMNLEVIYPKSTNVIDYDKAQIVFHGTLEYDESAKAIGQPKDSARMLAGMIKQVNQNVQKNYTIGKPQFLSVPKVQDFSKKKQTYLNKLKKLQKQYALKDSDSLGTYHESFWLEYIFNAAKQMDYNIPKRTLINLTKRWAFLDKSYKVPMMRKDIKNKKFLNWALSFDKNDHSKWIKQNMKPFEVLFFQVGAEILKNISGYLAASPDKAVQKIRRDVISAIKTVKKSKDIKKIRTLKLQLEKLNNIGGLDSVVPSEGIVFKYKGKVYKFTGAFAPVNQIVGLLNF